MAFQDLIKYGVNTHQGNLSLGRAAQQGFLEGEKRIQDAKERAYVESERNRIADEREIKELDAVYGELYVPPTGNQSYDAGVEMMGREWKAEYAALNAAKKAGQVDNDTFVQQKHAIMNRAQELKGGQDALNEGFLMYQKAAQEGQLSASTPARSRLFYQAMEDGQVQIQNIDGVPTLVGQVADGEPVQIPMAALANGTAGLKINQKVDTPGMVNTIAKTLEGYKNAIATNTGVSVGNVPWEQIQERAIHDVDQLLNNESTIQAIAADEIGLNHEEISALGPEELKDRVMEHMVDRVQREYFPVQQSISPTRVYGGGGGGAPSATQLKQEEAARNKAHYTKLVDNAIQTGDFTGLQGLPGIKEIDDNRGGFGIYNQTIDIELADGSDITIDPKNPQTYQALYNKLGINVGPQQSNQDLSKYNFDL